MGDLFHDLVGLGVDGGHVQQVLAVADAQEPGRLFERLGPDARHLPQLRARTEAAVLIPKGDDVEGGPFRDAGDIAQQRPRRSVQIDAHPVDAAFDHAFERRLKLALVNVVLILADADRLGIDLDQLGERVLQAAGNGNGSAHGEIEIGKFLPRNLRGGVDAGPGLADGHGKNVVELPLAQELAHESIRLAGSRAVADGDGAHVVPLQQRSRASARRPPPRPWNDAGR